MIKLKNEIYILIHAMVEENYYIDKDTVICFVGDTILNHKIQLKEINNPVILDILKNIYNIIKNGNFNVEYLINLTNYINASFSIINILNNTNSKNIKSLDDCKNYDRRYCISILNHIYILNDIGIMNNTDYKIFKTEFNEAIVLLGKFYTTSTDIKNILVSRIKAKLERLFSQFNYTMQLPSCCQ